MSFARRSSILPLFASPDIDKAVCSVLAATSLPAVRVCATTVFGDTILHAWMLADDFMITHSPLANFVELKRKRQDVQDKVCWLSMLFYSLWV